MQKEMTVYSPLRERRKEFLCLTGRMMLEKGPKSFAEKIVVKNCFDLKIKIIVKLAMKEKREREHVFLMNRSDARVEGCKGKEQV